MKVPQNLLKQFKDHFENIRWFFTIRKKAKAEKDTSNEFIIPQTIVNNVEYLGIDPQYYPPQDTTGNIEGSLPIYPIKLDFISKRDTKLNANVKARIFNDVTLLDVLLILCQDIAKVYAKKEDDSKNNVKFTISPPDNTAKYEQIIIEPGSFTDTIYSLQKKYGIYQSGVRVSFDSNHITKKENSTDISTETYITILEKGNTAPSANTINNCIIEVVDPKSAKDSVYDSGFSISKETSTMTIRSHLPYLIEKNNSEKLANGESVRVQKSSQIDHVASACDAAVSDINTSKMYWSNYDNPFAMTQLQDSIREKLLSCNIEIRDVDIFTLNDNMNYSVKFYSKDDTGYSGRYRLKKLVFYIRDGKSSTKDIVESAAVLQFYNLPDLRIDGSPIPRKTYSEY